MKVKLEEVCEKESSNIAQKDIETLEGEYPIYGASGFIKNINNYKQEKEYIAIVKDGAGVGRAMFLPAKSSVIGTLQYIIPRENINTNYLYYAISNMNLGKYANGATIPHIYFKDYKNEVFELPSVEQQHKIVATLDQVNDLISLRNQQLEQLDLMIKSRFVEIFGDPITNNKNWTKKKLSEECEIITGNTPSRQIPEYYGNYIEWIKSDNINTPNAFLTKASEYLSEKGLEVGRAVDTGAILMTCIAGSIGCIGNIAIANRKVAFNQQINGIVPLKNNTWFMYTMFELSKKMIQSSINMSLKGILSKGQLSEMEFIFPPLALQNQFADFVQQVDKAKASIKQSLEQLETLKKKLMQDYFG